MRAIALLALLAGGPSVSADTFDDGLFTAAAVAPIAGYFVPPKAIDSFRTPPDVVIAASSAMTPEELSACARGAAEPLVSSEFTLFVYPTRGTHAFLWTGRHDGQQQVLAVAWNGHLWNSGGHSDGRSDSYELVFAAPPGAATVHVLVYQQSGTVGHDRIRTERVSLAPFPGTSAILEGALAAADVVVSLPSRGPRETPFLDCVKGWVDAEAFAAVPGADRVSPESLVFLRKGADGKLAMRFWYRLDGSRFEGPHGSIADPTFDEGLIQRRELRFRLARRAAAVLAFAPAGPGDVVLELSMGDDEPFELFVPAITRSGRDGGDACFRFEVRRDGASAEIAPLGRFGADSFDAPAGRLEPCDALGFDYRFVRCGPGVVKLLIRPRSRPFDAEVTAIVTPIERESFHRQRRPAPSRSNTLRLD